MILSREQYFFDCLEPKYNILKIAGSPLGQKRSDKSKVLMRKPKSAETKLKISESLKGKTHSAESKAKMNLAKIGEKNPNFGKVRSAETKAKISITRGIAIFVYSLNDILENSFPSASVAGKFFNTYNKTILKYCSNSKIFKEKWILFSYKK